MKKILFILLIISTNCYAGDETGTVRFNHGQFQSSEISAGKTFFYLDGGVRSGTPACATFDAGERWVINNDWPAAKLQNSILLAAAVSGKKVLIRGTGNCNVWSDTETAIDIMLVN